MKGASAIFDFLLEAASTGERTALVTITGIEGSSSRAPGTHMAVAEDGSYRGSFSGGCVEAAVVGEALRIIADGRAELIRFGAGSRFIDIRLPCGGGLDLLFTPDPDLAEIREARQALAERDAVSMLLESDGGIAASPAAPHDRTGWQDDAFLARHDPELRLIIVGHGAETAALAELAIGFGAEVDVLTPDAELVASLDGRGVQTELLKTPAASPHLADADEDTAIVMLFHDHDWEPELLAQALAGRAFYVGAMGSPRTDAIRRALLVENGVSPSDLTRLTGPIGLIPATRDPNTLALSVLAEVVERHTRQVARHPHASLPIDDERSALLQ